MSNTQKNIVWVEKYLTVYRDSKGLDTETSDYRKPKTVDNYTDWGKPAYCLTLVSLIGGF